MTRERFTAGGIVLVAAVLVAGCLQPSLHPLIKPADAVFDERLLGTWTCGNESWRFALASELDGTTFRHYLVQISERGQTGTLRAWVGRIGTSTFINFYPDGEEDPIRSDSAFFRGHVIAVNTFGRLRIEGDTVHLDMLDSEWVEKASNDGRIALGVKDWSSDAVLLTAGTEALQAFGVAHADDDEVFGEHVELVRKAGREAGECL